ncbi:MAG: glycosyltransferase [Ktedonobacteraceae bacterium]|nr:glycosyltransferase [Ktedonobacteraceae bacterium]
MSPISVVIPTFNRAPLLRRAIDSTLSQTVQPQQVIVVDDGSTDNTAEICKSYSGRIDYIHQANGGASAARNLGIQLALRPWVAFLDSDDYWTPSHLENMVAAIEGTNGEARFYFSDMQLSSEEGGGTLWEMTGFHPRAPFDLTRDATTWMLMRRQPTMLQCCIFKKQVLNESGGFLARFRLMQDADLFCRLGIGATVCAVSGVGCVQTADAQLNDRLTGIVSEGSEQHFVEQSLLWKSALDRVPTMDSSSRQRVRAALADAYWRLCRFHWRSGNVSQSFGNLLRAGNCDPGFIVWLLRKRSSKGYGEQEAGLPAIDRSLHVDRASR